MTDLIKSMNEEQATNNAKIKTLEHEVYMLKAKNKALDKAIKALAVEPKKEE